jgi:prepilin-type N-terminal cleavage/methylation domain-containing protein
MKTAPTRLPRCGAFSLIELLVVIAIIAVLAMLGFSWSTSALQRSKAAQSIANMKQLGQAAFNYANDNNGALPPLQRSAGGHGPLGAWYSFMAPYLGVTNFSGPAHLRTLGNGKGPEKVFICPAEPRLGAGGVNHTNIGYGWNVHGIAYRDGANNHNGWQVGSTTRLIEITQPSRTILLAETKAAGNHYSVGSAESQLPKARFGNSAHALFCDGTVRLMPLTNSNAGDPGLADGSWWRVRKL